MSEFVITNDVDRYLFYDKFKKLCYTDKLDIATRFPTEAKAFNVLTCSFPKKKRTGWIVKEVEPKTTHTDDQDIHTDVNQYGEKAMDWHAISEVLEQVYAEVVTYKNNTHAELSKVEAELCDCDHACEFFQYNASKGYKLYSMIRERRRRRRYLKDEYKKAMTVLNMSCENIANGGLERVFKEIDTQTYKPRVLKDLFKV